MRAILSQDIKEDYFIKTTRNNTKNFKIKVLANITME